MQLTFEPAERDLLDRVLNRYLGDLRAEIGKTENFEMRQDLKHDEDMLKSLLERLRGVTAGA